MKILDIWIHTVPRRALADTLHKEGRSQKVWLLAECSIETHSWKKKKKVHKQHGRLQPSEGCQAKPIEEVGGALQGVDRGCSQCMKSHRRVEEIGYKSLISGVKPLLNLLLLVLCVLSSPQSTNLNVYPEILERFMLPSAGEIYCMWMLISFWRVTQAHRESAGYCQEEDERQQT